MTARILNLHAILSILFCRKRDKQFWFNGVLSAFKNWKHRIRQQSIVIPRVRLAWMIRMTQILKNKAAQSPTFSIQLPERYIVGKLLLIVLALVAILLLVLPLVVLLMRGVQTRGWEGLPGAGIPDAIYVSLLTSTTAIVATMTFGTPLAYLLARWRIPLKNIWIVFVQLPIVLPPAVAGLALLVTLGRRGLLGPILGEFGVSLPFTTAAVVIAQIFVAAPFYIRAALVGFQEIDHEIEDAARVDGASGWVLFWFITLPMAQRGLAAGLILSWARALGEFGATLVFAGSRPGSTQTMPSLVYNIMERDIDAAIWTGLLLVGVALIAMLLSQWLVRGQQP
ncbi:MAG: molybdate ABC transporter permease subunit [Phototrophicales bacterium]|nr:MAG: molybdate ABC transporter permease subunit [Phototrophicales bacterium]